MNYKNFIIRDIICIAFIIVDLKNLEILAGDIQNTCVNASNKKSFSSYAVDGRKPDQGMPIIIAISLYGLKSSALARRNHLLDFLGKYMIFKSILADSDVLLKPVTASDGFKHYSCILVYLNYIIVFNKDSRKYMAMIDEKHTVNMGIIEIT